MADLPPTFSLVTLGCPKNTVDSEGILGGLALAGFAFTPDPDEADLCIVNTCGFLDEARREAAAVLKELADLRRENGGPLLVATGCLVERAGGAPELQDFLAAADINVGFADYPRLPAICSELLAGRQSAASVTGYAGTPLPKAYMQWLDEPRMRIGGEYSAYLKLGEGCSNCCAYCSIPLIRGTQVSRSEKEVLRQARQLVDAGAVELNLIAQDTTAYGRDRNDPRGFAGLLQKLLELPDDIWFRVLYAHPRHLTEEILEVMDSDPRICSYLDLPLQHVNEKMLRNMGRGYGADRVREAMEQIQRIAPDMALRTTFIVGHPGEGEAEFEELLDFVKEGHFDHMGVFAWSPEPQTASLDLSGRVETDVAVERCNHLMEAQAEVSAKRLQVQLGRRMQFLAEELCEEGWLGRTGRQAPEIDGMTLLENTGEGLSPGDRVFVEITAAGTYDCRARRVEE